MHGPNEETPLNRKGPKDLEGRRCVDLVCLLLFAGFLTIFGGLTIFVYAKGDANKIFNGVDYLGNVCGQSPNVTGKPKVWYPRIADDLKDQAAVAASGWFWDINLYGICVASCPAYDKKRIEKIADYGFAYSKEAKKKDWSVYLGTVDLFNRCLQETKSDEVEMDLCVIPNCKAAGVTCYQVAGSSIIQAPKDSWLLNDPTRKVPPKFQCEREVKFMYGTTVKQPGANAYLTWLFGSVSKIKDTWESLLKNAGMIAIFGIAIAVVANFAWLILLYMFARIAVWLCISIIVLGSLVGSLFCSIKAGAVSHLAAGLTAAGGNNTEAELGLKAINGLVSQSGGLLSAADEQQKWMWGAASAVLLILFFIFLIVVCCAHKAINRCVVLVEQGSLAIGRAPGLSVMPMVIALLQVGVVLGGALTLGTLTTVANTGPYSARLAAGSPTVEVIGVGMYLFFGLCWIIAFLTAIELMTVAAVVFYFYFVSKKSVPVEAQMAQYDDNQTSAPVLTHLGWVVRYHLGTLAFGSLTIAIVTMIQVCCKALFMYLEKSSPVGTNFAVKMASSCIQCCLWCFKKSIEFINSYAYIYCFVENIGFCHGCMKTFRLICSDPAQIAINTSVQFVLAALLSITTPVCCATLAFIYFNFMAKDANSHSGSGGLVLPGSVFVIAFFVSRAFANVWEQVVQSLTVCVLHDVDNFEGRFLRPSMQKAFGDPRKVVAKADGGDQMASS